MRTEAAQADRNASVRRAARSWHRAGVIDEAVLKAVESALPDDRARVGPVFRVLLFVFTALAANAAFGFLWLLLAPARPAEWLIALAAIGYGCLLVVVTEFQIGSLKRSQGGTEAATSFVALGYLLGGLAWLAFDRYGGLASRAMAALLVEAALLLAAAAWRWGYPAYAGAAAAALLGALAHLPLGRAAWIVVSLLIAPLAWRLSESARLPPAHRSSWTAVLGVSLAGLYVAVHLGSFDGGLVEAIGSFDRSSGPASSSELLRWLSAAATAVVPLVFLAIAIRTRRYPFLLLGLGTAAASVITFSDYADLRPAWAVLAVGGIALSAAVLGLRRYLRSGSGGERAGFTAEPLFEDVERRRLLEIGAAVATLSPEARPIRRETRFTGGGGDFGGGGSSSEF